MILSVISLLSEGYKKAERGLDRARKRLERIEM
jgi:hypothetical protein